MSARGSAWRAAVCLGLLPLLGGCVAVAALPVLAGGAMVGGVGPQGGSESASPAVADRRSDTERVAAAHATVRAPGATASVGARLTELRELPPPTGPGQNVPVSSPALRLTDLSELPPPSGTGTSPLAATGGKARPWQAFADYALQQAGEARPGRVASALLQSPPSLTAPKFRPCRAGRSAVIVDLDPGELPFAPVGAGTGGQAATADVRAALARLREAGVAVLWISQQPANGVGDVAAALARSGLDPAGDDTVLLARGEAQRKQVLRERAGASRCIVAIAGDRRSDFDEVFNYLRDPATAAPLDARLGAGWFLVPPPLG